MATFSTTPSDAFSGTLTLSDRQGLNERKALWLMQERLDPIVHRCSAEVVSDLQRERIQPDESRR